MIKNVQRSFIIFRSGKGLTSSNKDRSTNFSGEKKCNEAFRGVHFFDSVRKNFKSNLVLVGVLVLESKGLYYDDCHHLCILYGYNSTRSDWLLSGQDFLVMTGHYLCPCMYGLCLT